KAVGLVAALTWLNPHVYLDTVVMMGSIAGQYETEPRIYFALGGMIASMVWFYGLGYGAAKLAPIFAKPRSWQILDFIIGIVMWMIAISLLKSLL
ncbi:MAG: LysE family transporter, partial [Alphaproteobacteria bacterium]|nr:LysE family transporter [Alphaproteobacteria bacterium]